MREDNDNHFPNDEKENLKLQIIFPPNFAEAIKEFQKRLSAIASPELKTVFDAFKGRNFQFTSSFSSPELIKAIEKTKEKLTEKEAEYEKKWGSIKPYLTVNGYLLPEDMDDFFHWYFMEKVPDVSIYEGLQRKIIDSDFIEYSIWRENEMKASMKKEKYIPVAAGFSFVNEPRPTIDECVERLLQVAHNTSGKSSHDLNQEIQVLHNVKTTILYEEALSNPQRDIYLKRLDLFESILKEKRQQAKERESQEDNHRIKKGLQPKYSVSSGILEYIIDKNNEKKRPLSDQENNVVTVPITDKEKEAIDIEKFTDTRKLLSQLQSCGQLKKEYLNEIKKRCSDYLDERDEDYYLKMGALKNDYIAIELIFIDKLLYPGLIVDKYLNLDSAKMPSEVFRVKMIAIDLLGLLKKITDLFKRKYLHQTPLTVENYLFHWETLVDDLVDITVYYGHDLRNNPYFPFVQNWLMELKLEYSKTKLAERTERLKLFQATKKIDTSHIDNEKVNGLDKLSNKFDSVPIDKVYAYFKSGLVEKKYLSNDDLLVFLDLAFDKRIPPSKKFVLQNVQSKQKIRTLFGNYYRNVAAKPRGRQREYAKLLGEYFEGYTTENVSTNFS